VSDDSEPTPRSAASPGEDLDEPIEAEVPLGPRATLSPGDTESDDGGERTEFALDEWSVEDRALLDRLLTGEEIPHAWQGATLVVPTGLQFVADELIDAVEAGPDALVDGGWIDDPDPDGGDGGDEFDDDGWDDVDAQEVLGSAFVAADRLRKRASDPEGVLALVEAHETMVTMQLPFGFDEDGWKALVDAVARLAAGLTAAEGSDEALGDEQVEALAEDLRARLRPLV
jgi:hypothetical protein